MYISARAHLHPVACTPCKTIRNGDWSLHRLLLRTVLQDLKRLRGPGTYPATATFLRSLSPLRWSRSPAIVSCSRPDVARLPRRVSSRAFLDLGRDGSGRTAAGGRETSNAARSTWTTSAPLISLGNGRRKVTPACTVVASFYCTNGKIGGSTAIHSLAAVFRSTGCGQRWIVSSTDRIVHSRSWRDA